MWCCIGKLRPGQAGDTNNAKNETKQTTHEHPKMIFRVSVKNLFAKNISSAEVQLRTRNDEKSIH